MKINYLKKKVGQQNWRKLLSLGIILFMICLIFLPIILQAEQEMALPPKNKPVLQANPKPKLPLIEAVYAESGSKDSLYTNEKLFIETKNFDVKQNDKVWLYINNLKVENAKLIPAANGVYVYHLKPELMASTFYHIQGRPLKVTLAKNDENTLKSDKVIAIYFYKTRQVLWVGGAVLLIFSLLAVIFKIKIGLPENSLGKKSLSLSIVALWSIVIAFSFLFIGIITQQLPKVTTTIMALLALPGVTAIGAALAQNPINNEEQETSSSSLDAKPDKKVIDSQIKTKQGSNKLTLKNTSIFSSGETEANDVHRIQAGAFNIIFALFFLFQTITSLTVPTFDESQLVLLGISNGVYVGLKNQEFKQKFLSS